MLELEHVSAVVAVVCEAVSQPCSPFDYAVSAALLGLTRLLVLTVVACSSNGHQVHVCALLGSACCISFIDATSSIRLRLRATQWNCASKPDNQIDQADRRIYFAATLTFCLDSIRSIGPGHDHSRCTQSLAIFALAHCARRYTKMQLTYFSQTGWRKCLSRWTTYNFQFTDNFIKYLFEGKSWQALKGCIFYGSFSFFPYLCNC